MTKPTPVGATEPSRVNRFILAPWAINGSAVMDQGHALEEAWWGSKGSVFQSAFLGTSGNKQQGARKSAVGGRREPLLIWQVEMPYRHRRNSSKGGREREEREA